MGKYRMYEPWGYQESNYYVSKKSAVEDDLSESKKNDKQELKDIEELKKSKVDNVSYDKNGNKIVFFANKKEIASIDTTDFVKDGMIESVELDGTVLKIIFNTESGKEEIDVDFKDIISGGTFYTKDEVDSKLDEKADKSDIPSLDEYAKTADVQAEIDNAVSGKADSSDVEAIEAQITPISSDITALKGKDDELQAAINLKAGQNDLVAETERASAKESEIEENVAKKVDWVESTPGRNHIVLKNHDSLLGTATDGATYNVAMVSKWDVADFGSAQLHANLNSKDGIVTINDNKAIATKDEVEAVDAKVEAIDLTSYAKSEDVNAELANKANASDITALNAKADELQAAIDLKASQVDFEALSSNVYTKQESDDKFLTEHQSLSGYATEAWVGEQGFLTEHQDISNLATKDEVESGLTDLWTSLNLAAEKIDTKADADTVYTKDEVDAMLAEKQAEIDAIKTDYKKLKEIVGDIGGAVEYSVPADGKLTDMLKKSGIIKLTEDVESNTYAGGVISKNITTLNLNGKTITTTANTTTNPSIMARGTQQFTIQGSGTLNANGHIAIEANGENAVITLGGTAFGKPTYITNREGELIYCYLGTINITNGVFRNDNENKKFLLNCYDANYQNGTAKIVVTGGKFYDFDPANNTSEGEGTSYVPEGYVSVESTETIDGVEHTVYTVKKG